MKAYAQVATRLLNTPLMVRPEKAEMFVAVLGERLGIVKLERMDGSVMTATEFNAVAAAGRTAAESDRKHRSFDVIDGIAFIPIEGTLIHRAGYVGTESGLIGYDGILTQCREAWDDPEVRAVWLDIDSPGGEVAGCFDCVDELHANSKANGGKPLWCMVNEQATSAAYAIASAGDKVFMPRTGITGSIGVYMLYVDQTKALEKEGLSVEFIRSGEDKARGNGIEEPLPDRTRAKLQARVDSDRELFAKTVARNRRMSVKSVMDTEGDWFGADDALKIGLIDGVLSEVEAFAKLQRSLARNT
jgi:capsid assembly protease